MYFWKRPGINNSCWNSDAQSIHLLYLQFSSLQTSWTQLWPPGGALIDGTVSTTLMLVTANDAPWFEHVLHHTYTHTHTYAVEGGFQQRKNDFMFSPPPSPPLHSASGLCVFILFGLHPRLNVSVFPGCLHPSSSYSSCFTAALWSFIIRCCCCLIPLDSHSGWTEQLLRAKKGWDDKTKGVFVFFPPEVQLGLVKITFSQPHIQMWSPDSHIQVLL